DFGRFKQTREPDEEMLWWLGASGLSRFERAMYDDEKRSQAFESAQIYVQRTGDLYAIVDCGDHGLKGRGSHAHSDALSFEIFAYDRTFVRDPGTYVYSSSECRRNLFRSTAYHNTVRVDKRDISEIIPGTLFSLGHNVRPAIREWTSTTDDDVLDVEHYGYARLEGAVVHRRVIAFNKREGYWSLRDFFEGEGEHLFEIFFNLDPSVNASLLDGSRGVARSAKASL